MPVGRLLLAAAVLAIAASDSVLATAQSNSSGFPDPRCFCASGIAIGIREGPLNVRQLVDGVRYDLTTFQMTLAPEISDPTTPGSIPQPAELVPFGSSSMMVVEPQVELLPRRKYGLGAQPSGSTEVIRLGDSFIVRDFVDTTPPTAGPLEVTDRVFENDCGAKALFLDVGGIVDDFWAGGRYAILVTLGNGEFEFQTVTTTFPSTQNTPTIVAKAPFLGDCITDEGLEALEFELGEAVEVTMVVYDYAGNASAPVVQTIEWPIGVGPEGGGCSVSPKAGDTIPAGMLILVAAWLVARREARRQCP